jgi:signal recognition particle GTPase
MAKAGLYANINTKKKRIAAGSGETMRKVLALRKWDC